MPDIALHAADGLTARDLIHHRLTATAATATLGELREYFAASTSRRLAVLVDGDRFAGVLGPDDIAAGDPSAPARDRARQGPVVAPDAPAAEARDAALADPSRRVPVVDAGGTLVGVVAIDKARERFCGTG